MLSKRIEELRQALTKEIEKGNLHTGLVLKLSQELDTLIVEFMKDAKPEDEKSEDIKEDDIKQAK